MVKVSKKKIDTNILGPKNAPPNSIDFAEGKGKGGWVTGLAQENREWETRLQTKKKKKGVRERMDPRPGDKKSDGTYQPFCGDAPRDLKSGRWGSPTALS